MSTKPGAAITLLKRLRTLARFALEVGWVAIDPTHKVRSFRSQRIHTWTEDEIATFEERWPVGTKQRLAFALHLYTGQRGSDVHQMTWADIAGDTLRVVQQKTGAKLALTLHPELQAVLSATLRSHMTIITTEYGKPFSVKGFGQFVSDAIRAAGLPSRCKAHGLRKAAARRLAEAGCTTKEIMAVTGHKTLAEVERYTAAAEQEELSRKAIAKQAGNTGLQTVANRLKEVK
jgi:integrase